LMECEHGFKKNYRGCDICACNEAPSKDPVVTILQSSSSSGKVPSQLPSGKPSEGGRTITTCIKRRCPRRCSRGQIYATDSFGCRTCQCVPMRQQSCNQVATCLNHCEQGYVKGPDGCNTCTCKTEKVCPQCMMLCEHGFKPGPDGCYLCECNAAPSL
jgi:hypothetical protein